MTIDSAPGAGTAVTLALPKAERGVEPVHSRYAGIVPGGHESLLLVEDDPDVRDSTAAILEELGYTVRTAADPTSALETAAAWDALDMVISDVVMPGDQKCDDAAHVGGSDGGPRDIAVVIVGRGTEDVDRGGGNLMFGALACGDDSGH